MTHPSERNSLRTKADTILAQDFSPLPSSADTGRQLPVISVVVPVMNEADNVRPLISEIHAALAPRGHAFEIVFVDDCSTDDTRTALLEARDAFPMLRVIRHDVNCGQSAAIRTGILAAHGPTIVTLDGDGQNDPADMPALLETLLRANAPNGLKMVAGQRRRRRDTVVKRIASQLANSVRSLLLQDGTMDTGCGLKAFDRESFLRLPYFDHMHRYFPALMRREGYLVEFVDVNHRPRIHGRSKYGVIDRLLVSMSDIFGVMWLNRRCRRPGARIEM